jgi:cyclopropane fatty-acyl-phospholipid synthase-like methyltransferase
MPRLASRPRKVALRALLAVLAAVSYDRSMTTPNSVRGRYGETLVEGLLENPAAERNKGLILDALRSRLPRAGVVLEIASGTGQHVVHFARALPALTWQPTDADDPLRAAAAERIRAAGLSNIRAPLRLDVLARDWPVADADAIVCINMIQVAPWSATNALLAGAARLLQRGAPLFLYGPYKRGGRHTAPSNEAFDESLRARNPEWGVRDLDDVERCAEEHGFALAEVTTMPANNLTVAFERAS